MRSLMMEVDEYYAWLIVLYNIVFTGWPITNSSMRGSWPRAYK
jgi:hypothetical protein